MGQAAAMRQSGIGGCSSMQPVISMTDKKIRLHLPFRLVVSTILLIHCQFRCLEQVWNALDKAHSGSGAPVRLQIAFRRLLEDTP
jgi:predicted ATP-grasp superfamily ATP-dependent carboligase